MGSTFLIALSFYSAKETAANKMDKTAMNMHVTVTDPGVCISMYLLCIIMILDPVG